MYDLKTIVEHKIWMENNLGEIDIPIVQHCNLNCASCDHFAPLAKKEFFSIERFQSLLNRLKIILQGQGVYRFNLMGGEPLLHPQLLDFCRITRETFPNSELFITTNGILINERKMEIETIVDKYNGVVLKSEYNKKKTFYKLNLYNKKEKFCNNECCNNREINVLKIKNNVSSEFHDFFSDFPCAQLNENGDYFSCIIPANIRHVNEYFNEKFEIVKGKDYVNIYEIDTIDELLRINKQKTLPFCRYCGKKTITEWRKTNYEKSEWLHC